MNKLIRLNKKASEKVISVYWFAILIIVAGAVVFMVYIFYGQPYDVRQLESNLLSDNIADCLSKNGNLVFTEDQMKTIVKDNFLEICHLNFKTEETWDIQKDGEQYYVNVLIKEFNTGTVIAEIEKGNINFKDFCEQNSIEGKLNPVCVERSFYSLGSFNDIDEKNKQYSITIKSIIRKTEKNVH